MMPGTNGKKEFNIEKHEKENWDQLAERVRGLLTVQPLVDDATVNIQAQSLRERFKRTFRALNGAKEITCTLGKETTQQHYGVISRLIGTPVYAISVLIPRAFFGLMAGADKLSGALDNIKVRILQGISNKYARVAVKGMRLVVGFSLLLPVALAAALGYAATKLALYPIHWAVEKLIVPAVSFVAMLLAAPFVLGVHAYYALKNHSKDRGGPAGGDAPNNFNNSTGRVRQGLGQDNHHDNRKTAVAKTDRSLNDNEDAIEQSSEQALDAQRSHSPQAQNVPQQAPQQPAAATGTDGISYNPTPGSSGYAGGQ